MSEWKNETKKTPLFLHRIDRIDKTLPDINNKAMQCPSKKYQWAELKSSLLVQNIIQNPQLNYILRKFILEILNRIYILSECCTIEQCDTIKDNLTKYANELKYAKQKSGLNSYPVGQANAFVDNPDAILTDFYALYNYMKYLWAIIYQTPIFKNPQSLCSAQQPYTIITNYLIIQTFQQRILYFMDMFRGDRLNLPNSNWTKTPFIGISSLQIDDLRYKIPKSEHLGTQSPVTMPWMHPGHQQCKVPYMGKYGYLIKKYKEEDDYMGSLQCGISGSTQFMTMMFLLSISDNYDTANVQTDLMYIILSAICVLTGDGRA